jgi:DNA polymerase
MGAKCRECPFSKLGATVRPVFGEGPANARGILVGESPGSDEVAQGRPFVGATGNELNNSLRANNIDRKTLFIVNAVACQPVGPKNDASMRKAVDCCRPLVLAQIRKFGSRPFILALGGAAFYSLHGYKMALDRGRGFIRQWNLEIMSLANWYAIDAINKEILKRGRKAEASQARAQAAGG